MKASTLLSEYVKADTVKESGPQAFKIKDWEVVEFKDEKTDAIQKKMALLVDDDQKVVLNKENTRTLIEIFGTDETDEWVGRTFEAYHDPSVRFAGKKVGGLRVRASQ